MTFIYTFVYIYDLHSTPLSTKYFCKKREYCITKSYFIIEKQLQRRILKYTKCLSYPYSFHAIQMINPFLNSRISANYDKVDRLSANMVKSYCMQNLFWITYQHITYMKIKTHFSLIFLKSQGALLFTRQYKFLLLFIKTNTNN